MSARREEIVTVTPASVDTLIEELAADTELLVGIGFLPVGERIPKVDAPVYAPPGRCPLPAAEGETARRAA